jgi:hypothetical protein
MDACRKVPEEPNSDKNHDCILSCPRGAKPCEYLLVDIRPHYLRTKYLSSSRIFYSLMTFRLVRRFFDLPSSAALSATGIAWP